METSIPGLYACGDVVGSPFQVAKAVYEGEIAGTNCSDYLKIIEKHNKKRLDMISNRFFD